MNDQQKDRIVAAAVEFVEACEAVEEKGKLNQEMIARLIAEEELHAAVVAGRVPSPQRRATPKPEDRRGVMAMNTIRASAEQLTQLGLRIREARTDQGVSLRKFSAVVELSPSYFSKVERGKVLAGVETYERILGELGFNANELFRDLGISHLELHPPGTADLMREMAECIERFWTPDGFDRMGEDHERCKATLARYKEMADE